MDIESRMRRAVNLTPTEQQLAQSVLAMGERIQATSIKELARAASTSIASVHRLCKKLGLEGFKELKVELARSAAARLEGPEPVDINFPFAGGEGAHEIAPRLELLYETTLAATRETLDLTELDRAAKIMSAAEVVDVYTQSHNLYPAQMFCDRLLSIGRVATCHEAAERQMRTALASDPGHAALAISYSGLAQNLKAVLPLLNERDVPVTLVGTPRAARRHPGLASYLCVGDGESLQNRLTQFSSHLAVHYVLDMLFSCIFARTFERGYAFLERSLPYTRLPGAEEG